MFGLCMNLHGIVLTFTEYGLRMVNICLFQVPMRMYAGCLRPDIQYKTVGVTPTTTCKEVVAALLAKCKVRYKDPRLFSLIMEVDIRGPVGKTIYQTNWQA